MRALFRPYSCALFACFLIGKVAASCYYPDGSFPSDYSYTPCSGDQFTSCCIPSEGDQCLSNGLCFYPGGKYMFRGACTDQSWNSPNCFQHCKGSGSTWDRIVSCGGSRYCCSSDTSTCCNDDSKVFLLDSASVINNLGNTVSYSLPLPSPSRVVSSPLFSSLPSTAAAPTNANPGNTQSPQSTSVVVPTGATNTAAATAAPSKSASDGVSKTAVIGGAVGGVVLLIGAVLVVWFLVRNNYRKKLAAIPNPTHTTGGSQPLSDDKTPRPVVVHAPLHSPAPPYQAPFHAPPPQNNTMHMGSQYHPVELEPQYNAPATNQWGHAVYEAPAHRD